MDNFIVYVSDRNNQGFVYDGCYQWDGFMMADEAISAAVNFVNAGFGTAYEVWLTDPDGELLECVSEG